MSRYLRAYVIVNMLVTVGECDVMPITTCDNVTASDQKKNGIRGVLGRLTYPSVLRMLWDRVDGALCRRHLCWVSRAVPCL